MEAKDQQIQTETIETEDQHVQVGSMALQQGVYAHSSEWIGERFCRLHSASHVTYPAHLTF